MTPSPAGSSESVAAAVVEAATSSEAVLILTLTATGTSARLIAKYRPRCPILVVAEDSHVGSTCHLHRGCLPFVYPHPREKGDDDVRFVWGLQKAKEVGLAKTGDVLVLAHGWRSGTSSLNSFRMVRLA
eukprot:4722131-Pleurochrysis_carterae.AAC.4